MRDKTSIVERPASNAKGHPARGGLLAWVCLTMSYFHGRMPTIIGAKAFHGPVRDGKEWFHFAIVVRHDLSAGSHVARAGSQQQPTQFGSSPPADHPLAAADPATIRHCDCVNEQPRFVLMRTKRRFSERQT